MRYTATVHFAGYTRDALTHEADSPDKARIEALQKAKLTGHEPESVHYDTDLGQRVYVWHTGETMDADQYWRQAQD